MIGRAPNLAKNYFSKLRPVIVVAALFAVAGVVTACTESLESNAGCPILCPNQNLDVREVVLDAVEFDATIGSFPLLGESNVHTIASNGDSLDSRLVVRFDSLPNKWILGGVETDVTAVDSAHFRFFPDTLATKLKAGITIQLYDVDTTAAETNTDAILALFRPDRLITSQSFATAAGLDTIDIPLPNSLILSRIQTTRRLRIGIRVVSDSGAKLVVNSSNQVLFPRLRYDPAPENGDFNVIERPPRSYTPESDPALAIDYSDYVIVGAGPFPLRRHTTGIDTAGVFRDSVLAVGGVAGRRMYLRFAIPDSVLRSSIIRATLILNKKPSSDFGFVNDTIAVVPQAIFATANVSVAKAVALNDTTRLFPLVSQRLVPRNSGEVRYDIISYARTWVDTTARIPFALSFRAGLEGQVVQEILFYSTSGPLALRPRLRITYLPRQDIGLP